MNRPTISVGQTLVYNDGRQGHTNVEGIVVALTPEGFIALFEDRADVTVIRWDEDDWMRFITFHR